MRTVESNEASEYMRKETLNLHEENKLLCARVKVLEDKLATFEAGAICVLFGIKPYDTGTTNTPDRSIVETWRLRSLADILRKKALDVK